MTHSLRIISWNINSLRLRLPLLERLTHEARPDIICLQETKVEDALFPLDAVRALGYEHCVFRGQKSYHGVAIASRIPLRNVEMWDVVGDASARHISATLDNGIHVHNLYVPAGGDIPDPALNPKFAEKLRCVQEMTRRAATMTQQPSILVGDFNIAPLEHDVWSHKQLSDVVSHTPIEIAHCHAWREAGAWRDVARHFIPHTEKLYSWWSYRARDWKASNRGRRLDHIWVSPHLYDACIAYESFPHMRDWEQPSDHIPIMLTFSL
ncbi:MAG: exodeoxyribonuclease III [Alphaproteobacteria bacterium]|nr:MAG: exodeoxyribonuclease III [Alphaproteobacteria bacterium]